MGEELNEVVNQEGSQPTVDSTITETEQDASVREDVQNTESDEVDYKALYEKEKTIRENLRVALKEARNSQSKEMPAVESAPETEPEPQTDEGVKRFLRTEADAYSAKKLALEPSYKEIMPDIERLVEQGYDVRAAEKMVKASRYDTIATQLYQDAEVAPKQINTRAIPEPVQVDVTLDNLAEGKVRGASLEDIQMANALKNV